MTMIALRIPARPLIVAATLMLSALTLQTASADVLRAHTTAAGSAPNTTLKLLSRYAEEAGLDVQVIEGQHMPRSKLLLARGDIEIQTAIVGVFAKLQSGTGPYSDVSEEAKAAAGEIRSLIEFGAAALQFVAFESSGIKTFEDFRGQRIYVGPGGGGAGTENEDLIRLVTGLEPDVDFTSVRGPWSEGTQAMRNGQVDVMARVAPVGAAIIQEFGLSNPIRIVSLGDDEEAVREAMVEYMSVPGRSFTSIAPGTYEGQVNEEPVTMPRFLAAMAVNKDVGEETAYTLTRAFWENIDEIRASAAFLRDLDPATPFSELNIPLHPGAIRYYEEAGVPIPDDLRP